MEGLAGHNLPLFFGLVGAVVVISALLSGFIEKSNFPQVGVFLALGAIFGPYGFGLLDVGLDSSMLHMVATLSLGLVLFTDALVIDIQEVRKHAGLAALILGPGTLIAAGLITYAGMRLLDLPLPLAAILAAPLASTDPVILRGLLKRHDLPSAARQALRLESGLNDVVLLPIILVAMAFAAPSAHGESINTGKLLMQMLVIGPGAGALVAWVAITLLEQMRRRVGVRRDYESLYSIGIALASFAAAESLHGSGFLAVFAAGLTISSLDTELCDCFREYGETTAEIMLLFTFVLLGASLIWTGMGAVTVAIAAFVVLALLARPVTLALALWKTKTDSTSKRLIVWFGPRGLSTLLLILVPIFGGAPGTEPLFHVATVVVLVSVALHGGSIMAFGKRADRRAADAQPVADPAEVLTMPEHLTPAEIASLLGQGVPAWLADVRQETDYIDSEVVIKDSARLHPQFARRDAERNGISKGSRVAVFCACPDDATAERVTEELRSAGWTGAFTVRGGWDALIAAGFETSPKPS